MTIKKSSRINVGETFLYSSIQWTVSIFNNWLYQGLSWSTYYVNWNISRNLQKVHSIFLLPQASRILKYSATNYIHRFAGRPVTSGFAIFDLDWSISQVYRKPIATMMRWWTLTPDVVILMFDIKLYGLSIKSRNCTFKHFQRMNNWWFFLKAFDRGDEATVILTSVVVISCIIFNLYKYILW